MYCENSLNHHQRNSHKFNHAFIELVTSDCSSKSKHTANILIRSSAAFLSKDGVQFGYLVTVNNEAIC
jgi:hypothetical protein